jgi:hypothetical protein
MSLGYNEGWSRYKVFIMATKFLAVTLVVIISKDNCLFHRYPRQTVELVRQVLVIILNIGLLGIHLRTQAFLSPAQNNSETSSRIGQLLVAIIGVLVVLNVGPSRLHSLLMLVVSVTTGLFMTYFLLQVSILRYLMDVIY